MITFSKLLKLVEKQYHFDACFIAYHLHIDDEIVESWEKGEYLPNDKEAEDFSNLFALPLDLVINSIEEEKT